MGSRSGRNRLQPLAILPLPVIPSNFTCLSADFGAFAHLIAHQVARGDVLETKVVGHPGAVGTLQ